MKYSELFSGGIKSIQTGFVDSASGSAGTSMTEDWIYVDVAISAVADIAKCDVSIDGGGAVSGSPIAINIAMSKTATTHEITARLTSTTNLRVSMATSGTHHRISGRWKIVEHN